MEFIELLRFEKRIVQYFTYFNLMKTFVIYIVLYKVVKIDSHNQKFENFSSFYHIPHLLIY